MLFDKGLKDKINKRSFETAHHKNWVFATGFSINRGLTKVTRLSLGMDYLI
jgi:hypothetical protein